MVQYGGCDLSVGPQGTEGAQLRALRRETGAEARAARDASHQAAIRLLGRPGGDDGRSCFRGGKAPPVISYQSPRVPVPDERQFRTLWVMTAMEHAIGNLPI